jgi:2-polyprenyl-3-methyl-5-hydroxy-6-metoxy-1,4-benzoquinol methylase
MGKDRYEAEKAFFDAVASSTRVEPMPGRVFERYKNPRNPHLFSKEMMFSLLGRGAGLRVLEVGCGDGVASIQLSHCGHQVVGVDISPRSIAAARERARIENQSVQFVVANIVTDDVLGESQYDVVWCDAILHHLVSDLDIVMSRCYRALRKNGLFIAREPIAYAGWLKKLRSKVPVETHATPDEQPLRPEDFAVIRSYFPDLQQRYYRIVARIDRITGNLAVIGLAARLDNFLLRTPAGKSLAGTAVMWAQKKK